MPVPFPSPGLANAKTLDITDAKGEGLHVKVTKTNAKHAQKPAKRARSETVKAASGRKVIAAVAAEAAKYRPDLKVRPRSPGSSSGQRNVATTPVGDDA